MKFYKISYKELTTLHFAELTKLCNYYEECCKEFDKQINTKDYGR